MIILILLKCPKLVRDDRGQCFPSHRWLPFPNIRSIEPLAPFDSVRKPTCPKDAPHFNQLETLMIHDNPDFKRTLRLPLAVMDEGPSTENLAQTVLA